MRASKTKKYRPRFTPSIASHLYLFHGAANLLWRFDASQLLGAHNLYDSATQIERESACAFFEPACNVPFCRRAYLARSIATIKQKAFRPLFACTLRIKSKEEKIYRWQRETSGVWVRARHPYVCGRMKLYSKPVVFEYQIMHSGRKVLHVCVSILPIFIMLGRCHVAALVTEMCVCLVENIGIFASNCCY